MSTLRLFWVLISRNVLAGLVMGLLFGGICGFLFAPVLLVILSIASGLQGRPAPPDLGGMGFALIFGGFFGGVFGLIAGAFFGPFLGCINGLIMSVVTRLWFMPLTDVTKYERVMRGCTILVMIVGTVCAFTLTFGIDFMLIYAIVPALLFGLGAGPVSKRLIRPYLGAQTPN